MFNLNNKSKLDIIQNILLGIIFILFLFVFVISIFALLKKNPLEAPRGDFSSMVYEKGWYIEEESGDLPIDIPFTASSDSNSSTLYNYLPNDIISNMTLMFRVTSSEVWVYIDGNLVESYTHEVYGKDSTHMMASAYLCVPLDENCSGKKIELKIKSPFKSPILKSVRLAHGNNAWFEVLSDNLMVNIFSFVIICFGIILFIIYFIVRKYSQIDRSIAYLGMLMVAISLWCFSESNLRQLIFESPSYCNYFTYICISLVGIGSCLYVDAIQKFEYHKYYVAIETLSLFQLIVNTVLHFLSITEFHYTLKFIHLWIIVSFLCMICFTSRDIFTSRVKTYKLTCVGLICFMISGMLELISYYIKMNYSYGMFLNMGLIILMIFNVSQTISDVKAQFVEREREQLRSLIETIETISNAIDAKDEYTGGHSERVGKYAGILAGEIAKEYNFNEQDVINIQYIGLMHDFGKIGVADTILNKVGRLTDEEFSLMKKHATIGYELLKGIRLVDGLPEAVKYHHERYDGKGYPDGLKGEDIPLVARILCLADCYDAMTSNRVYRNRLTDEEVSAEIIRCSGTQFDPKLAEVFVRLINEGKLKPDTLNGMSFNKKGKVSLSSAIDTMMHSNLSDGIEILNPSHVRMLSYIVKLFEDNNNRIDIFVVDIKNNPETAENLKKYIDKQDVNVDYTIDSKLICLFCKSQEEIDEFTNAFLGLVKRITVDNVN